ncbi:hypothetical protein ACLBR5_10020 [Escherichia coli]
MPPRNPTRRKKHIVRATNSVICVFSIFYLCSIFVVVALIPWNMPGLKAVCLYRSVLELLEYSPCEICNHGLRDITFRNQLSELGAVYRVKDVILKPSR